MSRSELKARLPDQQQALPGRDESVPVAAQHYVNGHPLQPPFPDGMQQALFGMGCFWGAERKFWQLDTGIWTTAVGYAAGFTQNPTYEQICTGRTGHNEVVKIVFDPTRTSYQALLKTFWESHDPTQGMAQGNDTGTQYRSGIYWTTNEQREAALTSRDRYSAALKESGLGPITTEIVEAPEFYFAEAYHC